MAVSSALTAEPTEQHSAFDVNKEDVSYLGPPPVNYIQNSHDFQYFKIKMNKHDEGDPDNSVLISGTDEIQLLISSSSRFIYLFIYFSFVIRGRRMKTFSTVAARMLPADDK